MCASCSKCCLTMDYNCLLFGCLILCSISISYADLDSLRFGCPIPNLNPDDCEGLEVKQVCNTTSDCFRQDNNKRTVCCVTDCGGTDCIESPEKRGECPVQPAGFFDCTGFPPATLNCGVDGECPGKKKCCFNGCIGTDCYNANGPKSKRFGCPFPKPQTDCPSPQADDECIFDDDCTGGKTCCRHPCGHAYCSMVRNRKGECAEPGIKAKFCTEKEKRLECGIDRDCGKRKKCCQGICGSSKCMAMCIDNRKWRGSIKSENDKCNKCSCKKLNKVGVLMQKACLNNVNNIMVGCCKSCKPFAGFHDPSFEDLIPDDF